MVTQNLARLSEVAAALGDCTRLRILEILWTRGETCVCELMEALHAKDEQVRREQARYEPMTQSNISFHLTTLRHARLVTDRKIGKWVFYTVNMKTVDEFREELQRLFQKVRKRKTRCCDSVFSLCCSGKLPLSRSEVVTMVKSKARTEQMSRTGRTAKDKLHRVKS